MKVRSNVEARTHLLGEIVGHQWNYYDSQNLRGIASRIEVLDITNDNYTSKLGREYAIKVLKNLADILDKEYNIQNKNIIGDKNV